MKALVFSLVYCFILLGSLCAHASDNYDPTAVHQRGKQKIKGSLTVDGPVVSNELSVRGPMSSNRLSVDGPVSTQSLMVDGDATFSGTVNVNGAISGTIDGEGISFGLPYPDFPEGTVFWKIYEGDFNDPAGRFWKDATGRPANDFVFFNEGYKHTDVIHRIEDRTHPLAYYSYILPENIPEGLYPDMCVNYSNWFMESICNKKTQVTRTENNVELNKQLNVSKLTAGNIGVDRLMVGENGKGDKSILKVYGSFGVSGQTNIQRISGTNAYFSSISSPTITSNTTASFNFMTAGDGRFDRNLKAVNVDIEKADVFNFQAEALRTKHDCIEDNDAVYYLGIFSKNDGYLKQKLRDLYKMTDEQLNVLNIEPLSSPCRGFKITPVPDNACNSLLYYTTSNRNINKIICPFCSNVSEIGNIRFSPSQNKLLLCAASSTSASGVQREVILSGLVTDPPPPLRICEQTSNCPTGFCRNGKCVENYNQYTAAGTPEGPSAGE